MGDNEKSSIYFFCSKEIDSSLYSDLELSGKDGSIVWTYLTARYLNKKGFIVGCGNKPPRKGIVIFHGKDRKNLYNSLSSFNGLVLVCIQADCNFKIEFSDYWIYQNKKQLLDDKNSYEKFCHFWTQPELIKRDVSRGVKVENIHYKGLRKHLCFDLNELDPLSEIGCRFDYGEGIKNKEVFWRDYSEADLLVAVRSFNSKEWINKPASKLLNAWAAGVPALLGKESAYQSLKKSKLDYIEVSSVNDIFESIKYLKDNPNLYSDMIGNGLERSRFYNNDSIADDWIDIISDIRGASDIRYKYINMLPKRIAYFLRKKFN